MQPRAALLIAMGLAFTSVPLRAAELLPAGTSIAFSGVRITDGEDPHAYGPTVELCKKDGKWSGFIAEYLGPVADPASARLEALRLDESKGRLSFTAQLTIGVEPRPGGGQMPARRRYEFSGRIEQGAIAGALAKRAVEPGTARPATEEMVLKREPAGSAIAMSCEEWNGIWDRRTGVRNAWGEAVAGVQLQLALANGPMSPGELPPLQAQLRNLGNQPVTFSAEALTHPEIQIDGIWYVRTLPDDCCSAPRDIAPGASSDVLSFPLPQVLAITSDLPSEPVNRGFDSSRAFELKPGRHVVRIRSVARDVADIHSAGSRPVVLTSNEISIDVPAGTRARPAAYDIALTCKAGPGRSSAGFHGTLKRGDRFTQTTNGWILRLVPLQGGWDVQVTIAGRENEDLAAFTPPLHGPNQRDLFGWHFRNADNTGPNDGSVNMAGQLREFIFSPAVGREIQYAGGTLSTRDALERIAAFGRGWLYIDSFRLTPPEKGERAAFESIAFHACLTWPAG